MSEKKRVALGRGLNSLLGGAPAQLDEDSIGSNHQEAKTSPSKSVSQANSSTNKEAPTQKSTSNIKSDRQASNKEAENQQNTKAANPSFQAEKDSSLKGGFQKEEKKQKQSTDNEQSAESNAEKNTSPIDQKNEKVDPQSAEPAQTKPLRAQIPDEARVWSMAIDEIRPQKDQPRKIFDKNALQELSQSISEKGILQPIVVRRVAGEEGFSIIAGERRWRAAQLAGLHEVPVLIRKEDKQGALELALIENIQREDLNPVEEAQAYSHLMNEYDLTQQDLSRVTGKERSSIANILRLLNLQEDVRGMVAGNELSLGLAKLLLSVAQPKQQLQLARQARDKSLTVRQLTKLIRNLKEQDEETDSSGESEKANANSTTKTLVGALGQDLQKALGTKVRIDYNLGKGQMIINFYSDDQLNQIADRIKGNDANH